MKLGLEHRRVGWTITRKKVIHNGILGLRTPPDHLTIVLGFGLGSVPSQADYQLTLFTWPVGVL